MDTNNKNPVWTELVKGTIKRFMEQRDKEQAEEIAARMKKIDVLRQRGYLKDPSAVDDLPEPTYIAKE